MSLHTGAWPRTDPGWSVPLLTDSLALFSTRLGVAGATEGAFVVRLRGLPWNSKDADIEAFLEGVKVVPGGIRILDNQRCVAHSLCTWGSRGVVPSRPRQWP